MKLQKVYIKKYKHLHDFEINFHDYDRELGNADIRFFIGKNGSGKSAFMEALGLIFTRVLQDESPGFIFELVYSVYTDGAEIQIKISNRKAANLLHRDSASEPLSIGIQPKFEVSVRNRGAGFVKIDLFKKPFSSLIQYHPKKIISCSSGPNNIMENVLVHTPSSSLKSDVYDASNKGVSFKDYDVRQKEIDDSLRNLGALADNPRCLYIDGNTAKLVLIALFASIPGNKDDNKLTLEQEMYCSMRDRLVGFMDKKLQPVAFSIVANSDNLEKTALGGLACESFRELLYIDKEAEEKGSRRLNDWVSIQNRDSKELENLKQQKVAGFKISSENSSEQKFFHVPKVNSKWSPMQFLTILLTAKYNGLINDAHIVFKHDNCDNMLSEAAFSDGEYLWLARMGLILMSQDAVSDNCLFLFDEPDVHLNENWTVDFVKLIQEFSRIQGFNMHHEFIIATHSSLILTDADPDQLYHFVFEDGKVRLRDDDMSTFGANMGEISKKIFGTGISVGRHSNDLLEEKIAKEENLEKLEDIIVRTGPGYFRFRLLEKYFELESKSESRNGEDFNADKNK